MKNLITQFVLQAGALLLMAGSTSCGGAAALDDQLAQGSLTGSASDDGTIDQGRGDNGVVSGGNSTDDDGTPDQGSGDFGGDNSPGDDDGTADQGRGDDRNDDDGGNSTDDDGTADQGHGDN